MADHIDSEITPEPADSMKAASPAKAATSSTPEISRPMFEVHAPHESIHTWKEFFIHIATIVVGLLIAIGLEQTVEAIHHSNERRELIREMREEAEHNIETLRFDIQSAGEAKRWTAAAILLLQQTPVASGSVTVTLPAGIAVIEGHQPSRAVWDIAKSNGKAGLIPDNLAEIYDRQAFEATAMETAVRNILTDKSAIEALEARFHGRVQGGATLKLSPQERDELVLALSRNVSAASAVVYAANSWQAAAEAVAHNVQSRAEIDANSDSLRAAQPQ
jgi:hypothetical protein